MKTHPPQPSTDAVFYLDARELFPHPSLDRAGVLPDLIARETRAGNRSGDNREDHKARAEELSGEFAALVADIAARGILEPLKVTKGMANWLIADGRNRWEAFQTALDAHPEAAKRLESQGIPCIEIPEDEVPATILSAMTRRHLTKQAKALIAVRIFPEVAEAVSAGRPKKFPGERGIITQSDLAARVGVGVTVMEEACLFWRKLKLLKNEAAAEDAMNQVFAGISFHHVLCGLPQALKQGQARPGKKPWLLMKRNAGSIILLWKDFPQIEDEDKKLGMVEELGAALAAAPNEVKPLLIAALERREA